MRLFHEIDVHLDPFPFNGQTTTCNALWMGAATVTLEGLTHVSRVGVSLMTNMGLEDFVARSRDEYVRNAVEMGGDLDRLGVLRREMRERMRSSALMDRAGFRSAVDDAYRNAWREWCAGRGRA
jgi:predicted O-linked N-acetylglucosamine transferase (SPINDLY family)